MPSPRKRWPDHAEAARIDVICHGLSIRTLAERLQEANERGDSHAVALLNRQIWELTFQIQDVLIRAKRGTYDADP